MQYSEVIKVWNSGKKHELLNKFYPQFTYNSNKIENMDTAWSDVESIFKGKDVARFKGNNTTVKEILNHKKVCDSMLETISQNKSKLSIELIKQFHHGLASGCFSDQLLLRGERPGEFKKGHYVVGYDIGAKPSDVERNLSGIIDEVNDVEINANNALKVVSFLHNFVEMIHPFADFNGRVGRILINYILMANDIPPIIVFEEEKRYYYSALEYFNEDQEIDKMVSFLKIQACKTWDE